MAIELNLWIYLLASFMLPFTIGRFFGVFLGKRSSSRPFFLATCVAVYIFTNAAFLFMSTPLVMLTVSISCYYIFSLNYKATFKRRVFGVTSILFILVGIEVLIGVFLLAAEDLSVIERAPEVPDIALLFLATSHFLIALLVTRIKNLKLNISESRNNWVIGVLTPIFSLALMIISALEMSRFAVITTPLIFLLNLFIFHFQNNLSKAYEDKLKSELAIQEKEYYFFQNELMIETIETVKSMRHDMKLHLSALRNYATENSEITTYINGLIGEIEKSEVYSDTGNIALDSIINFKLRSAKEDGVKISLDLFAPSVINIETADIIIILGNLLDNALEAVAKAKDKFINIHIVYQLGNLLIRVENGFDGVVRLDKQRHELVTIKPNDGHGYGLKNIRKSAEKYNGAVDVTYEDCLFAVEVLLYGE